MLDERAGLAGKVAVVSGGGGGLGGAIAEDFARAGMRLAICDRDGEVLAERVAAIGGSVDLIAREMDVRDGDAVAALFAEIDERFGVVDVVVNVPGGSFVAPFLQTRRSGWEAVIRQNFTHVLDVTHHGVSRMVAAGRGGSVINITSVEAHRAIPGMAVYGAMKAAVTSLTHTLAVELAPHAIRVNTIAPDVIVTPAMVKGGFIPADTDTPEERLRFEIALPMGRFGRLEELGNCALFLASDLSSYVTGATIPLDGGSMASSGWFNWPSTGFSNFPPPEVVRSLVERGKG